MIAMGTLLKRLNRKLAHDGTRVRATRGERHRAELGDFYEVDVAGNCVVGKHVDPVEWAKELGLIRP